MMCDVHCAAVPKRTGSLDKTSASVCGFPTVTPIETLRPNQIRNIIFSTCRTIPVWLLRN